MNLHAEQQLRPDILICPDHTGQILVGWNQRWDHPCKGEVHIAGAALTSTCLLVNPQDPSNNGRCVPPSHLQEMEGRKDSWGQLQGTYITWGCFPIEEESPRSQLTRVFYNNRVQSRKHAPSVNSVMQKRKQLKQIVSLWQYIVTAVTQLHGKAQTAQHGEVPSRNIIYSSNNFFCG